jgi:putative Ig domain-containing protein
MTPIARTMRVAPSLRVEPAPESQRAIPFDYTFRFDLKGEPGATHRAVVTVSVEGSFTAVSIGYGVLPGVTPIVFGPVTIAVNPPTLPAGRVGVNYPPTTITQTGGVAPVAFSLSEGALPRGMNLSSQGVLSGTPAVDGDFSITVRATDDDGAFGERDYLLEITSGVTITVDTPTLPAGNVGVNYLPTTITQTGGVAPVTFSLSKGPLPGGMNLSSDGVLEGTPAADGDFRITVRATGDDGAFGERDYLLRITRRGAITINPDRLPDGRTGAPYRQALTQTGAGAEATFSLREGALPRGLALSPQGVLSGTPTVGGVFPITVAAFEGEAFVGERAYVLGVTLGAPPSLRSITINELLNGFRRGLAQALEQKPDLINLIKGETDPQAAFKGGIKLNPRFVELTLLNDGRNVVSDAEILQSLFQVGIAPSDEVQFLYALFDDGSGREFQSEPLLNTAGLGSSDGDRPFRYFARPITFAPRSVIRMEITEKSDFQGELHVSLHGYKALGNPGAPTGRSQTTRSRARRR